MAIKKYRTIPIGSLEREHATTSFSDYMRCGNSSDSVDFHGVDMTWNWPKPPADPITERATLRCLNASIAKDRVVEQYEDYPIPTVILSGCEAKYNHTFDEVPVVYENLSNTFSGTITRDYFDGATYKRGEQP
jgi:Glucanosyltransferase